MARTYDLFSIVIAFVRNISTLCTHVRPHYGDSSSDISHYRTSNLHPVIDDSLTHVQFTPFFVLGETWTIKLLQFIVDRGDDSHLSNVIKQSQMKSLKACDHRDQRKPQDQEGINRSKTLSMACFYFGKCNCKRVPLSLLCFCVALKHFL